MKTKTSIYDFSFSLVGYGKYLVVYTSPSTSKQWRAHVTNMCLIDATKNSDDPKAKDLSALKFICKNGYYGLKFING